MTIQDRFPDGSMYTTDYETMRTLWGIYMQLITDDGTPAMRLSYEGRRTLAQKLGSLLEHRFEQLK